MHKRTTQKQGNQTPRQGKHQKPSEQKQDVLSDEQKRKIDEFNHQISTVRSSMYHTIEMIKCMNDDNIRQKYLENRIKHMDNRVNDIMKLEEKIKQVTSNNCEPIDKNLTTDPVLWHEIDKGSEVTHKYVWFDKSELVKQEVQPKHLVKLFLEDENKFLHFITKD